MQSLFHRLKTASASFKKILPGFLHRFLTKIASAFLTPLHFSRETGHFKSSWQKKSVNKKGDPIPWYTYPLIDFLKYKDFSEMNVLEWGGGHSSYWWAQRVNSVFSFETSKEWFDHLIKNNQYENLEINYVDLRNGQDYVPLLKEYMANHAIEKFDIIIIDGMRRDELVLPSIELISETGFIIIDDSDRYDFSESFNENGFDRIDFYGYCPGTLFPKCSSIQSLNLSAICTNDKPV